MEFWRGTASNAAKAFVFLHARYILDIGKYRFLYFPNRTFIAFIKGPLAGWPAKEVDFSPSQHREAAPCSFININENIEGEGAPPLVFKGGAFSSTSTCSTSLQIDCVTEKKRRPFSHICAPLINPALL